MDAINIKPGESMEGGEEDGKEYDDKIAFTRSNATIAYFTKPGINTNDKRILIMPHIFADITV